MFRGPWRRGAPQWLAPGRRGALFGRQGADGVHPGGPAGRNEERGRHAAEEQASRRGDQISALEGKVAGYEEQLLTAYDKLRADEQLSDKAQRAMAIAIALLEEQKRRAVQPLDLEASAAERS